MYLKAGHIPHQYTHIYKPILTLHTCTYVCVVCLAGLGFGHSVSARPSSSCSSWVPDRECLNCTACHETFSWKKRRHHCRSCGQVRLTTFKIQFRLLVSCYAGPTNTTLHVCRLFVYICYWAYKRHVHWSTCRLFVIGHAVYAGYTLKYMQAVCEPLCIPTIISLNLS